MPQKGGFNTVLNCKSLIIDRYLPKTNSVLSNKPISIISARSVFG